MPLRVERSVRELKMQGRHGRTVVVHVRSKSFVTGWATHVQGGIEVVVEVRLTCLHWHLLQKPQPLGEDPRYWLDRSYRCKPCGNAPGAQRRVGGMRLEQVEKAEKEQSQHLREAIPSAVADPTRLAALVTFVEVALQARSLHATSREAEVVYDHIDRQARLAGLLPHYRPEEDWGIRA